MSCTGTECLKVSLLSTDERNDVHAVDLVMKSVGRCQVMAVLIVMVVDCASPNGKYVVGCVLEWHDDWCVHLKRSKSSLVAV